MNNDYEGDLIIMVFVTRKVKIEYGFSSSSLRQDVETFVFFNLVGSQL